jgi:hypothetical protein
LKDNVCTAEVLATLDLLAAKATVKWPFEQFHNALMADKGTQEFKKEAKRGGADSVTERRIELNDPLAAIRFIYAGLTRTAVP